MKCGDKKWRHCNKEKMGCEGCYYEDKIEIGEFVRNTFGDIYIYDYSGHPMLLEDKFYNRVVKHSKEIIDLIEVGDYVNGELLTDIYYGSRVSSLKSNFSNEDIKSILTKEMFEANVYKLEEK